MDAGGVNGAGAIVQSGAARGDAVNGLTVSLAAFESAGNVAYGAFGVNARVAAVTPGGGFTEIAEHASAENPGSDLAAEWAPGDNSIDASWIALDGGALGIENRVGDPPPPPVPVASVQVSPAAATVVLGGTVQLTATAFDASGNVLTGRAFTWQSDDNGVARVSANCLVTGVAGGPATITATAEGISGASDITVTAPPPGSPVVLVGAGDIADCSELGDEATAALLDNIQGTVFTTGDNAYPNGSTTDFTGCYQPSWGRHPARTRPAPGNHDYNTSGAAGYFA